MIPRAHRLLDLDNRRRLIRRWRDRFPAVHRVLSRVLFGGLRRQKLHVHRATGLGDVLLCTPALREAKRLRPDRPIILYTDYPELVRGLAYLDEVRPSDERPREATLLTYEECVPPRRHVARLIGELIGVDVTDVRPDCVVQPEALTHWRERFAALRRPIVVVSRRASNWSPNKDWPAPSWEALLPRLCQLGTVVEIGSASPTNAAPEHPNHLDLRGQTTLTDLPALLQGADLHLGPDSGPMHIAAAVGCPAVILFGGYTLAHELGYPGHVALETRVPCAPCWLRTPCPFELRCLSAIEPEQVLQAVIDRLGPRLG